MGAIFDYIRRALLWVLNIPLWQILLAGVAFLLAVWVKITYRSLSGGGTKPEPDTPIDDIEHFDKRLDVFRAAWDIYGRFEAWPAVLSLAEMSKNAYLPENEAKSLFQQYGLTSVVPVCSPFHSQYAYIVYGEDVLAVVFRGTHDTEDWFFNANVYPRQMAEGNLHCGFACAYGTLRTQVLEEIKKVSAKHIWITGHSLGGALALVCAYDLTVYQGYKIDGVITFGQPRIGKPDLAASLQERLGDRYVHFINEMDAVPQVPPDYSHFGLALQFFHGKVRKSSDYFRKLLKSAPDATRVGGEEYVPLDRLPEMSQQDFDEFLRRRQQVREQKGQHPPLRATNDHLDFAIPLPQVDDHSMERYIEKIRSAIDKASGH
jgi:pimeloyl-ACP methyl ester carboxylesterase